MSMTSGEDTRQSYKNSQSGHLAASLPAWCRPGQPASPASSCLDQKRKLPLPGASPVSCRKALVGAASGAVPDDAVNIFTLTSML